jgi:hypothetical protein
MPRASLSLFLAFAITACTGGTSADAGSALPPMSDIDIGDTIAEVSGFPIGASEFEAAAARVDSANGESFTDEEKREILNDLVTEKMLYLHARATGVDRDPKVQKVMVNTLLRERVYAEVRNSDFEESELQAYFDEHSDEFVVPEKYQVLRIFIRGGRDRTPEEAESFTQDLRAQVAEFQEAFESASGEAKIEARAAMIVRFKALASEHSEDPYRRRGGDLGFMSRDGKPGIDAGVVVQVFEMNVDGLSDVFEAGGGSNLVMVVAKREQVSRTFAQMKGSVLRKVKAQTYRELYDAYVDGIDDGYTVSIDDAALSGLNPRPARRGPMSGNPALLGLGASSDDNEDDGSEDE